MKDAIDPSTAVHGPIGKYEVVAELGRGGFGTVYQARHAGLNKLVAIKVLHRALLVDQVNKARFELEARAGANLSHPNLVSVFDYGFTDEHEPYLVMEFVEGTSLDEFLAAESPGTDDLLNILIQVGKALRYLHDSNIVHRDLKTSNILVQDIGGERYARLLDLGIAKVFSPTGVENSVQLTSTGMIFGSPAFMSPEQCQGQKIDARSDIYSFGCVMYQCMTGEIPFDGENSLQVILKHLHDPPKSMPYKTQREFELTQVVSKCLAKEPAQRYQSMKDLLDALQKIAVMPKNEKAQNRQDSLSRSYAETSAANNARTIPTMVAAIAVIVLAAACVIPLCGMLASQISKGISQNQSPNKPPETKPIVTTTTEVHQPPNVVPISNPVAQQPAPVAQQPASVAQQPAPLAQQPTPMVPSIRDQIAQEELQKATEQLAAEKAKSKLLAEDAAVRAVYLEKAKALSQASNERFNLVQQSLRAFDQSTQSLQNGNTALQRGYVGGAQGLRQYNDRMAERNGLGR